MVALVKSMLVFIPIDSGGISKNLNIMKTIFVSCNLFHKVKHYKILFLKILDYLHLSFNE